MPGLAAALLCLGVDGGPAARDVPVPVVIERARPLYARVGLPAAHPDGGHGHDDDPAHGRPDLHAGGESRHAHGVGHGGFEHHHASPLGTPQLHGFLTEPAFLGRDVLAHAAFHEGETELEVEVEWALSERALVVAGLPHAWSDEEGDALGRGEAAFRWVVRSADRSVLSVQAGVEVPTRSEHATGIGASVLGWLDLGRDVTLQGDLGVEVEPEEDAWDLAFAATLAWTTPIRSPFVCPRDHAHGAEPRLSLLAEVGGGVPLADDGDPEVQGLLGLLFPVTRDVELRVAWVRALSGEDEGSSGLIVGTVVHL